MPLSWDTASHPKCECPKMWRMGFSCATRLPRGVLPATLDCHAQQSMAEVVSRGVLSAVWPTVPCALPIASARTR